MPPCLLFWLAGTCPEARSCDPAVTFHPRCALRAVDDRGFRQARLVFRRPARSQSADFEVTDADLAVAAAYEEAAAEARRIPEAKETEKAGNSDSELTDAELAFCMQVAPHGRCPVLSRCLARLLHAGRGEPQTNGRQQAQQQPHWQLSCRCGGRHPSGGSPHAADLAANSEGRSAA